MSTLILVEIALGAFASLGFVVLYALRSPWRRTVMGRHLMMYMAVTAAGLSALLALGLGAPLPLWAFAVGLAALDVVALRQVWLLWRAQQDPKKEGL